MNHYAPIIVLVYDRIEHFKRCISSLENNAIASKSILYVVSDAAYRKEDEESIQKVREYAQSIKGFQETKLLFREKNLGGHISCDEGIKTVLAEHDSFIILEDDVVVSSDFLQYMNDGLNYYKDDKQFFAICGHKAPFQLPQNYNKDIYFYFSLSPWGFAVWEDRWKNVNFDYFDRYSELKRDRKKYKAFLSIGFSIKGIIQADSRREIEAGDVRIYYHMFQNNMYAVFPIVSKSQNWGFDGSGEHCGNKNAWWAKPELDSRNTPTKFIPFTGYDEVLLKNYRKFQDKINGGFIAKYLKYTRFHALYKRIKKITL